MNTEEREELQESLFQIAESIKEYIDINPITALPESGNNRKVILNIQKLTTFMLRSIEDLTAMMLLEENSKDHEKSRKIICLWIGRLKEDTVSAEKDMQQFISLDSRTLSPKIQIRINNALHEFKKFKATLHQLEAYFLTLKYIDTRPIWQKLSLMNDE